MEQSQQETLKARYARLEKGRAPYLDRARDCAKLTIPMLVPPVGASATTKFDPPPSSLGARGVNNLASRIHTALMPPNTAFFRYTIDDILLEQMTGQEGMRAEVELALSRRERACTTFIEASNARAALVETLKLLIVAGNALAHVQETGGLKVFHLERYVVKRDPMGNPLEIITKENLSVMELPEKIKQRRSPDGDEQKGNEADDTEELYTQVKRTFDGWEVIQEIDGELLPETAGKYPVDKCPWMALRFIPRDGEDYGRSYVEEYLGDLKTYNGLTKAITKASAAAAKVLFLIKPNATTKAKTIATAESGDVKEGNIDDIGVLQLDKQADMRIANERLNSLEQSLSYAFLLNSAVQRSGERVTAEEIRYMAAELEAALGGIYAMLSQEFQLPYVRIVTSQLERTGVLPPTPAGSVKPTITTGVEGIGRNNDLSNLRGFLQDLALLGPEGIAANINIPDYASRLAAGWNIDSKGLVPTDEERAATAQQQQQDAMIANLGPNAINQVGGIARDTMAAGREQPTQ